jgi:DNA-binding MarR family transcriptional regulator
MTPTPAAQPASTRWLSAAEREAWRGLVRVIVKLPGLLDDQLERDADLNFFEYMVLAMLSEREDRTLRMTDLAAVTNATLPRLSNVAKRLEARKLLKRRPDPSDGRFTQAILTERGLRLVVTAAPGHVETVRDLVIDAVNATQLRQLHAATAAILARIDPDPIDTDMTPLPETPPSTQDEQRGPGGSGAGPTRARRRAPR